MKHVNLRTSVRLLSLILLASACSACSLVNVIQPVQAWEKGKLAKKEMTFDGDPLENKYGEHIYSSKESAFGGTGVGGGGCGCN